MDSLNTPTALMVTEMFAKSVTVPIIKETMPEIEKNYANRRENIEKKIPNCTALKT
jgi:hypothetical protein